MLLYLSFHILENYYLPITTLYYILKNIIKISFKYFLQSLISYLHGSLLLHYLLIILSNYGVILSAFKLLSHYCLYYPPQSMHHMNLSIDHKQDLEPSGLSTWPCFSLLSILSNTSIYTINMLEPIKIPLLAQSIKIFISIP